MSTQVKAKKEIEMKFEFYDEKKFKTMPASKVNETIEIEKRRYRLRNLETNDVVFLKSYIG